MPRKKRAQTETQAYLELAEILFLTLAPDGTVLNINEYGARLLGYAPDEIIGRRWMEHFVPASHRGDIETVFRAAIIVGAEDSLHFQNPVLGRDGRQVMIYWHYRCVRDENGRIARVVSTGIDVTERSESERRLRQRDQEIQETRERLAHMERLSTLNAMTAGIAHELNQPLAAITIYAQACFRLVEASFDEPELKRGLKKIEEQVGRAAQVIRRLRTLVNKRESVREDTQLNDLINETVEIVRIDGPAREVEFKTTLAPSLPPARVDAVQIQQVLLNLLLNSVDALEVREPGERRIEIGSVLLPEGSVRVSVRDNGIGLIEDTRNRIFSPFFSTKSKGMGMGLHISHSIIAAHGGNMGYNSCSPGTEFFFILPLGVGE